MGTSIFRYRALEAQEAARVGSSARLRYTGHESVAQIMENWFAYPAE